MVVGDHGRVENDDDDMEWWSGCQGDMQHILGHELEFVIISSSSYSFREDFKWHCDNGCWRSPLDGDLRVGHPERN